VIIPGHNAAKQCGSLMVEALVAIALLVGAFLPLAYSAVSEKQYLRKAYQRAVAMEIVDGQMEILAAGGWREFTNGVFELAVRADAATNLPPGKFTLSVDSNTLRLEWRPEQKVKGGSVVRSLHLK